MLSCSANEQRHGNTREYNVRKFENCYAIHLSIEDIRSEFCFIFYATISKVSMIHVVQVAILGFNDAVVPTAK